MGRVDEDGGQSDGACPVIVSRVRCRLDGAPSENEAVQMPIDVERERLAADPAGWRPDRECSWRSEFEEHRGSRRRSRNFAGEDRACTPARNNRETAPLLQHDA